MEDPADRRRFLALHLPGLELLAVHVDLVEAELVVSQTMPANEPRQMNYGRKKLNMCQNQTSGRNREERAGGSRSLYKKRLKKMTVINSPLLQQQQRLTRMGFRSASTFSWSWRAIVLINCAGRIRRCSGASADAVRASTPWNHCSWAGWKLIAFHAFVLSDGARGCRTNSWHACQLCSARRSLTVSPCKDAVLLSAS